MNVTIIGTGNMARGIASRLLSGDNRVTFVGTETEKAQALVAELGGKATAAAAGSVIGDEVVILAVPYGAVSNLLQQYGESLAGKVVIDITNPLNETYSGLVTAPGTSAAEEIAASLPEGIRKAVFVDEPVSIYAHADWSEQERRDAGGTTTSAERMVAAFTAGGPVNNLITDMKPIERSMLKDSPYFVNSEAFASAFIKNDPKYLGLVLFDHVKNDWRDVLRHKVNVPTAIFSGEESNNLPSQRWMKSAIPDATLYSYTREEQGDHFLMFKNPVKFTSDLRSFLEK